MDERVIKKFWKNVKKTNSCWEWKGPLNKRETPVIRIGSAKLADGSSELKEYSPRRVSLELAGFQVPLNCQTILTCGNSKCVRPDHIIFGEQARFWIKVNKLGPNDCWLWTAGKDKDSYGKFAIRHNGKRIDSRAHAFSWELHNGKPVPKGMLVCHTCDTPSCVNPAHLFIGTPQDNTDDMIKKNRHTHGEESNFAKLTEEQVKKIRQLHKTGMNYKQIADLFDVQDETIRNIVLRKNWRHVV